MLCAIGFLDISHREVLEGGRAGRKKPVRVDHGKRYNTKGKSRWRRRINVVMKFR